MDGTDDMLWIGSEENRNVMSECEEHEGTDCEDTVTLINKGIKYLTCFVYQLYAINSKILRMYFLNDFEMVPVTPIITGITLVFTFHMHCISIVRSLYFKIFSASFLITFLSRSPEIATSINIHVPASLSRIIMSGFCWGWFCQFVLVDSTIWLPYPL